MGIPSEMRDAWASRRKKNAFFIASPAEEQRIRNARNCTQEGVRAGAKAATIACVATAVPTIQQSASVPILQNLGILAYLSFELLDIGDYKGT